MPCPARDIDHLDRSPRCGYQQLGGALQQPLAGGPATMPGNSAIGGGDDLRILGKAHGGPWYDGSMTSTVVVRLTLGGPTTPVLGTKALASRVNGHGEPSGATHLDASPASPSAAGRRRRHGARARRGLRSCADARRRRSCRRGHGHRLPLLHQQGPSAGRRPGPLGGAVGRPPLPNAGPGRVGGRTGRRRPRSGASGHGSTAAAGRCRLHRSRLARTRPPSSANSRCHF